MAHSRLIASVTVDCIAAALLGILMVVLLPSFGGDTKKKSSMKSKKKSDSNSRPSQITYSALSSLSFAMVYLLIAICYESVALASDPGKTICALNEFMPILYQLSRCMVQIFFAYRIDLSFKGSMFAIPKRKMFLLKSSIFFIYFFGCAATATVGTLHYTSDRHNHHGTHDDHDDHDHDHDHDDHSASLWTNPSSMITGLQFNEDSHDEHDSGHSHSGVQCLINDLDHWVDWQTILLMGLFVCFDIGLAIVQIRLYVRRLYQLIVQTNNEGIKFTPRRVVSLSPTASAASMSPVPTTTNSSGGSAGISVEPSSIDKDITVITTTNSSDPQAFKRESTLPRPPTLELTPTASGAENSASAKNAAAVSRESRNTRSKKKIGHTLLEYLKRTTILAVISIVSSLVNTILLVVIGRTALALDMMVNALCIYFSFSVSLPMWRKLCEDNQMARSLPSFLPALFFCCSTDWCECDSCDLPVCQDPEFV